MYPAALRRAVCSAPSQPTLPCVSKFMSAAPPLALSSERFPAVGFFGGDKRGNEKQKLPWQHTTGSSVFSEPSSAFLALRVVRDRLVLHCACRNLGIRGNGDSVVGGFVATPKKVMGQSSPVGSSAVARVGGTPATLQPSCGPTAGCGWACRTVGPFDRAARRPGRVWSFHPDSQRVLRLMSRLVVLIAGTETTEATEATRRRRVRQQGEDTMHCMDGRPQYPGNLRPRARKSGGCGLMPGTHSPRCCAAC